MAIYKGTLGLIGNTPLVEAVNIEKKYDMKSQISVDLKSEKGKNKVYVE